jgi:multiple sugar transport system substrate-binding protein
MAVMVLNNFGRIGLSITFMLVLLSCTRSEFSNTEKLLYWSSNNPDEIQFAKYIVNQWNTANPQREIVFQPVPEGRSSEEVILAAVVGKTTPDIYSNMWQGDVEFFARSGVLIPLDTLKGFLPVLRSRCDSSVIREITSADGHIYQIPWKINPIMLIYNTGMFKQIGWEQPPATYSEFFQAARAIQIDSNNDGYIDRWIGYSEILATWWQRFFDFYPLYLAASSGGKLVDNDKIVFDNSYAVEVFNFLKTVYDKNYFSRELLSARQDVFLTGIIATRFTGPWEIIHAEKFKSKNFEYSFSPMPVPDDFHGNIYTYGDPKNIVLFNTCANPQKAWEFLKFIINEENDYKFLEMTTQLPRRKELFRNTFFRPYFENHPKMIPFAKQAEHVRGTDICPQLKEIFDVISQEYEACVVYGVKTPEQAVHDAAKAAQVLLD